jgi:hypothetical protein
MSRTIKPGFNLSFRQGYCRHWLGIIGALHALAVFSNIEPIAFAFFGMGGFLLGTRSEGGTAHRELHPW